MNMFPRQQLMHTTIEELLEAVFSLRSVPRLYSEDHWEKLASHGWELQSLGVSQLPASKDVSTELDQFPLLGAVTKQRLEKT
jgi:hypothetical protein